MPYLLCITGILAILGMAVLLVYLHFRDDGPGDCFP